MFGKKKLVASLNDLHFSLFDMRISDTVKAGGEGRCETSAITNDVSSPTIQK